MKVISFTSIQINENKIIVIVFIQLIKHTNLNTTFDDVTFIKFCHFTASLRNIYQYFEFHHNMKNIIVFCCIK